MSDSNGNSPDLKALTADLLDQILPGRPMSEVLGRAGRRQAEREQSERAKLEAFCGQVIEHLSKTREMVLEMRREMSSGAIEQIVEQKLGKKQADLHKLITDTTVAIRAARKAMDRLVEAGLVAEAPLKESDLP